MQLVAYLATLAIMVVLMKLFSSPAPRRPQVAAAE
jgi:hypothetical protein